VQTADKLFAGRARKKHLRGPICSVIYGFSGLSNATRTQQFCSNNCNTNKPLARGMRAIRLRVCVHLFAALLTSICIAACGVQTNLLFISSAVCDAAMMDRLLCGVCFYCISSSRISISLVNIIILCAIVCSRRRHLRPTKQLSLILLMDPRTQLITEAALTQTSALCMRNHYLQRALTYTCTPERRKIQYFLSPRSCTKGLNLWFMIL
jgi:hypothetical protein